jgi:hypothetical protein
VEAKKALFFLKYALAMEDVEKSSETSPSQPPIFILVSVASHDGLAVPEERASVLTVAPCKAREGSK